MNAPAHIHSLVLVHSTATRPDRGREGLKVSTSFSKAGGMEQSGDNIKFRQTLHYCLQSAVTDHAYGSFEGRPWVVVAPLMEALEANGRPESLLASDVAFFPDSGVMTLPKAQLVELTKSLPEAEFIRKTPDGFQVSTALTEKNISQARAWFDMLADQGADVSMIQKNLKITGKSWSVSEITEMGVSSALAHLKKPTLAELKGIEPGSPMSFDGWMGASDLAALKQEIERTVADGGMGPVRVGRHDGMAGDRLMSAVARANRDELHQLKQDPETPPRIVESTSAWLDSDLLNQRRQAILLEELAHGPALIANDLGQERPGIVGAFFGPHASTSFIHPQLGGVSMDEVISAVKSAPGDRVQGLNKAWASKIESGEGQAPAFNAAQGWLLAMRQSPPPLPPPLTQVSIPEMNGWRARRSAPVSPQPSDNHKFAL